jgi:hypothetical protein
MAVGGSTVKGCVARGRVDATAEAHRYGARLSECATSDHIWQKLRYVGASVTFIDSAILDFTEAMCRRFQRLTGRTNVWLAVQFTNLSIVVYFVWAGMYFWRSDAVTRAIVGLFCAGLLYLLTQTIFRVPIETSENNAYRRVAKGLRNPRRVRDALLRILFLTLTIVLLYPVFFVYVNLRLHIVLLSYSLIILTTVVLYLLACDPLPPAAGKVREWLRGSARLQPVAQTIPGRRPNDAAPRARAERSSRRDVAQSGRVRRAS